MYGTRQIFCRPTYSGKICLCTAKLIWRPGLKAEIISIGTELLLGKTVNQDAAIIAGALADIGVDLLHMQTVGDNAARLEQALELASKRSEIIITSGGLGPTDDDLTKTVAAKFAGVPLVEYPEAVLRLKEYFGDRPMSVNQMRQAYLPAGSTMFPNSVGTAPGCATPFGEGRFVILLPGPPVELKAMLEQSAIPFLLSMTDSVIQAFDIRTFGIGEGVAAERIADLMQMANPTVAPYASGGEMFVRITAKAPDRERAVRLARPIVEEIRARLGDVVYGENVTSLEEVVLDLLLSSKKTIATAESCTGGLLAKRLTDVPGSSGAFQMGLVTYSNPAKEKLLGISPDLLLEHGAVSPQVAIAMAENMRRLAGSDFAIGITGIAGPDGATPEKPLGLVYIALADAQKSWSYEMKPRGRYLGRAWVRERAASTALDLLRRALTNLDIIN